MQLGNPSLREAWAGLSSRLKMLEPVQFSAQQWSVIERLHEAFNDREAHTHLPMPIARFREADSKAIFATARQADDVMTVSASDKRSDAMATYARLYDDDVDQMMQVLVPAARFRKGHYAYGKFTVPQPHGLHTDHSLEDRTAAGEPICIARIETLGTHCVVGDYKAQTAETQSMIKALRYWINVPEGRPEEVFDELLRRQVLQTIPVNHVMLMVAGNASENTQVTQHMAATPPEGGLHSAFFQRQYKLA